MSMKPAFVIAVLVFANTVALAQKAPAVDPAYQASVEKWKADLVEDLKQNWLPLAGLFWLKPGDNTFGTDPANALVLPANSAPGAGRQLRSARQSRDGKVCSGSVSDDRRQTRVDGHTRC